MCYVPKELNRGHLPPLPEESGWSQVCGKRVGYVYVGMWWGRGDG